MPQTVTLQFSGSLLTFDSGAIQKFDLAGNVLTLVFDPKAIPVWLQTSDLWPDMSVPPPVAAFEPGVAEKQEDGEWVVVEDQKPMPVDTKPADPKV